MNGSVSSGSPLVAIVLAAGGSSRFGAVDKLSVEVDGRPLIAIAVAAAIGAGCFDAVLVVTGAVDVRPALMGLSESVTILDNPRWSEGMATSLQAGIVEARRLGADAVVVGLADQPGVGPEDWRTVALTPSPTPILVAVYEGCRGNPVRLDREVWDDLPTTGDEGARSLMARRGALVTAVACPGDASDVDVPEDLERWS